MKNSSYLKHIFVFLIILFFGIESYAQFSFSPSTTLEKTQSFNRLSYDSIHITNNSNNTLNLKWELIQYESIDNTSIDFCASGECYIGVPATGSFPTISSHGFGWAGVHFWTGSVNATATAKIWVYNDGDYNNGDTLTFIIHASEGSSISSFKNESNLISIYPNPASNKITINSNNTLKTSKISILDIYGKTILEITNPSLQQEFSIENLSNGIYFVDFDFTKYQIRKKLIISK